MCRGNRIQWQFYLDMSLIEFFNTIAFYKAKTSERNKRLESASAKGFNPYVVACLNEML